MSIRHRCLGVYFVFTLAFPLSILQSNAGPADSDGQPVGAVGLSELIMLALRNDPGLIQLRGQIPVAEAEKRAIKMNQWRDPELRVGLSKDDNIQLDQPYERSGSITETIGGSGRNKESGGRNGDVKQRSASSETRTTTYKEKVIPGENSDRIIRTETERRSTDSKSKSTDDRGTTKEKGSETETFRSTRDETRFDSRDPFARDQSTSVKIRFWIPKPWETKALINQAAKEVDLANFEVTAAEREVVLEVREAYEDLQYTYKKLKASTSQIAVIKKHVAKENAILESSEELTVDDLGFEDIKIPGIEMKQEALQGELERAKSELAARVGLSDGSRIRVTDKLLRSNIDLQGADLDYLTRMAYVHRGEIGILKHEQAITESELDIIKSERIPWFSFIEAAYAKDSTGGSHTNDNYGFQFGVVLPLFSWLSKDEEVVQERIKSYYSSITANQKHIANEVAEAFRSVKATGRGRSRAQSASAAAGTKLEAMTKRLEKSEDPLAIEKLRYDIESKRDDFYEYILAADRRYNQALIRLEEALGADLDRVFNYKFEPIAGAIPETAEDEIMAAAAAASSSHPAAPKAKVVPKKIQLPSQPAPQKSAAPEEADEPKRNGIFSNLLKKAESGDEPTRQPIRRGISNRKR